MKLKQNTNGLHAKLRVFFNRGLLSKICFVIIVAFLLAAILAPLLTPYSPYEQNLKETLKGPSRLHLLGTDNLGRDILTRLLYGARISFITSIMSGIWGAVAGTALGLISGYFGKLPGQIIMRITDAMISIPPIIINMVLAAVIGGNLVGISVVIGVTIIPTYIRMVNGVVLSLRENDYVLAARLIGQSPLQVMLKHLLPNCFTSLIVIFTMNLGTSILQEANLSFLGVGITAPTPAWGTMISEGYKYLIREPRLAILPGLCVVLIVVAFNIVGDGLRDALDPRLRGKL